MLLYNDFLEIHKHQATVFTPNFTFSTGEVFKKLINMEDNIFDGDPFMLPLPAEAPIELPRIILESKDKRYKFEMSPVRMNFFQNKIDDQPLNSDEFSSQVISLMNNLLGSLEVECNRVAMVIDRISLNDNAAENISSHFCKNEFLEEPIDRPSEFEIHSLKKFSFIDTFDVNSWVRIKSGRLKKEDGIIRPMINVHQDINTTSETTKTFNETEIRTFFKNVYDEFDKILKLYIPE